jgi:hypothetical protein
MLFRMNVPKWSTLVYVVAIVIGRSAQGQTLDRGHMILLRDGLQIQAQVFPVLEDNDQVVGFNLSTWADSNFSTVNFQWNSDATQYLGPAPGIPWGQYTGGTFLQSSELPYLSNMVSLQFSDDEENLNNSTTLQQAATALSEYRAAYPSVLSFTNQAAGQLNASQLANYMSVAQPDMLIFDSYPFNGSTSGTSRSPTSYYATMQEYRLAALAGNDGTGKTPIPYGLYMQTYVPSNVHYVSDSEIRLNEMAAWAFGYTFVSAYTYDAADSTNFTSVLFNGVGDSSPTVRFNDLAQVNRESMYLGPSLVRLLSTDVRIIPGKSGTTTNPVPSGMSVWNSSAGPYITGISATNIGTQNGGEPGDVLVGYFKPLSSSFEGANYPDETYFMIVNGLVDPSLGADCQQAIHMTFNFGTSGIDSLEELNTTSGQVQVVPLVSDGGSLYHLDMTLNGGDGELFKFDDGSPFVVPEPASFTLLFIAGGGLLMRRRVRI